jgi:hypothetical protein
MMKNASGPRLEGMDRSERQWNSALLADSGRAEVIVYRVVERRRKFSNYAR